MDTATSTLSPPARAHDTLLDLPLAEIALAVPGSTAIFRRYKLDFCCGGADSLRDAAAERGIDANEVAAAVRALTPPEDEAPVEPLPLIDYILTRFHETHRRDLPELIALARKVESVHADHPEVPRGLTALLEHIAEEIESHMQKEEQILFPLMRAGGNPMIEGPIDVMRHEHDEHGVRLRKLEALTRDHTPPADACTSWRALYAGTRKLVDDVMQHIHYENNVLFPQYVP